MFTNICVGRWQWHWSHFQSWWATKHNLKRVHVHSGFLSHPHLCKSQWQGLYPRRSCFFAAYSLSTAHIPPQQSSLSCGCSPFLVMSEMEFQGRGEHSYSKDTLTEINRFRGCCDHMTQKMNRWLDKLLRKSRFMTFYGQVFQQQQCGHLTLLLCRTAGQ